MSNKDLPPIQDLGKGNGAVIAPVVEGGDVVDENDKVVVGALVDPRDLRDVHDLHRCERFDVQVGPPHLNEVLEIVVDGLHGGLGTLR